MQETSIGEAADLARATRGDLVFWKGHVAIMLDHETMLHANGYAIQVTRENLAAAIKRISTPVTAVNRL